ncbi:hypothetical protein P4O66_002427 [Electrophorus voltai]|uniref:Uncharacterized protein n=1 Tax=Electrophorus voltai TaxID=2609070 RepID=A0AAD8YWB0_9TELE|nr:hypothetical protein P4O66_002427 [Electrophorus voltai]
MLVLLAHNPASAGLFSCLSDPFPSSYGEELSGAAVAMCEGNSDVDLTRAKQNTGVWLVKVSFSLSEELTMVESKGEKASSVQVPREHPFTMQSVGGQTVAVFSEGSSAGGGSWRNAEAVFFAGDSFVIRNGSCAQYTDGWGC